MSETNFTLEWRNRMSRPEQVAPYADSFIGALHGLKLICGEIQGFLYDTPTVCVVPVFLLVTDDDSWSVVESRINGLMLPLCRDMKYHFDRVAGEVCALRDEVWRHIGKRLEIRDHISWLSGGNPGVKKIFEDDVRKEYLIITGQETHFIRPQSMFIECPGHVREYCKQEDRHAYPMLENDRVAHKSFFIDDYWQHCASRTVHASKMNIERPPFCELLEFERFLCCRACLFWTWCHRSDGFEDFPCEPG